jgi:hypothetical protein
VKPKKPKQQLITPLQAMHAKLATSLLTVRHAKLMQLRPLTEAQVNAEPLNIQPRWEGFQIPYFTLDGKPRPDNFYRFRFTVDRPSKGWASIGPPEKPRRYAQPPDSGCAAYFPPLLPAPWRAYAKDPAHSLGITEGELKAACACSLGIPVIGLGGVNNWRTATMNRDQMLPELEEIVWAQRTVIIVFDSNIANNPQVRVAASLLASVLTMRGAVVKLTNPPPPEEGDTTKHGTGLDDWLYALSLTKKPPVLGDKLAELLLTAPEVEGSAALHAMNLEIARVVASKDYVQLTDGRRMTKRELLEETEYGGRSYKIDTGETNGHSTKSIPTAKTWLTWRFCRELRTYVYRPGHPKLTPDGCYNTWPGWGVQPSKGDVRPFVDLIQRLTGDAAEAERRWLLQWLAAPLQRPGLKLRNGVVMWGGKTGTGKTLIGQTMRRIYGENFGEVESKHFHSNFNSYVVGKQFILGDEISVTEKRSVSERLKVMLTREQVSVEEKYQIPYTVDDCANYYFTSNYPDAFYVEAEDRRFFVQEVTADPMTPAERDKYFRWLPHGAAHLFDYLLNYPMDGFDPYERPPTTAAKTEMIELGDGPVRVWIEELKRDPTRAPLLGCGGLTTVKRLIAAYKIVNEHARMDAAWMGRELARAGIRKAARGSPTIKVDGAMTRVHIIGATPEQTAKYQNMRPVEIQEFMEINATPRKKFEDSRNQRVH